MTRRPAGTERASTSTWARIGALALLLLEPTGGGARTTGNEADSAALRTSQAAIGRRSADHQLFDQHGRRLRLAQLQGRPLVVSFVFTNCSTVCSGLTLHLRDTVRIARQALGDRSFSVLTVGFDSAHDTPQRMQAYGRDRGIDDPDWRFASADAVTLRRFTDELGFTWAASPRGFDHITQVTIVDAQGIVAQQVYGEAFEPPELIEPLKQVLLQRNVERASVQGLIERVRLYCSVYDPASRRYRFDYSMIAASLPALLILGMVILAIAVAGRPRR